MYPEYYIVVKEDMFVLDEEDNEIRLEPGEVYEIRTLYGGQEVVVVDDIEGIYWVVEYGCDYKIPFDTMKQAYTYLKEGVVKYYNYKLI